MDNKQLEITDLIPYLNTDRLIQFTPNDKDWIDAKVVGINIPERMVLVDSQYEGKTYKSSSWILLYFQLNKHNPRYYKIRLKK